MSVEEEENYADPHGYPRPAKFDKIIPPEEQYVAHGNFRKFSKNGLEKAFVLIVTRTKYYKLEAATSKKLWEKNLLEIQTVQFDDDDPFKITLTCKKTPPSTTKAWIIVPSASHNMDLSEKVIIAETPDAMDEWFIIMRALVRDAWQALFESQYISAPDVYQVHFFAEKINRKGKSQVRCIVVSTEKVYNIDVKAGTLDLGKLKWSFPITSLTNVYVYNTPSNMVLLRINSSHLQKVKPLTSLVLRNKLDRNIIVGEIRRIYFSKKKYHLPKEELEKWNKNSRNSFRNVS